MSENSEIKPYSYFDAPSGEDVFNKWYCLMKPTALTAAGIGIFDVLAWSHPKGYLPTLGRLVHVCWPLFGASTAFVVTSNISSSLRKKDDNLNWFIGGFAAGSVFGLWRKRTIVGFNMGMLFGTLAVIRKIMHDNNWLVTPPNDIVIGSQGVWDYDFTLTKHRPGNWTTGK
ncbi:unnamed protein product [Phaedon cochleariae]|uniref:NADH dehydrogenase [ubiquinone] 1 alpha subcomplex subunit 11 n=1 Tax=Phaedon cochleariae TaxID=80249 RepID=A0A9P0GME2_PHACE|nr:unnamed protein product [Phaedon cochleariae]